MLEIQIKFGGFIRYLLISSSSVHLTGSFVASLILWISIPAGPPNKCIISATICLIRGRCTRINEREQKKNRGQCRPVREACLRKRLHVRCESSDKDASLSFRCKSLLPICRFHNRLSSGLVATLLYAPLTSNELATASSFLSTP